MKVIWCAAGLALFTPLAAAQPAQAAPPRVEIAHCTGGPPLTMALTDPRAVLDDADRVSLVAEMSTRYPILARDGFEPPIVLLWRKSPNELLYVSLQPKTLGNGTLCFTASFVAERFGATPNLILKYLPSP